MWCNNVFAQHHSSLNRDIRSQTLFAQSHPAFFTATNLSNTDMLLAVPYNARAWVATGIFNDCPQTSFSSAQRASAEYSKDEQCGKLEIVH